MLYAVPFRHVSTFHWTRAPTAYVTFVAGTGPGSGALHVKHARHASQNTSNMQACKSFIISALSRFFPIKQNLLLSLNYPIRGELFIFLIIINKSVIVSNKLLNRVGGNFGITQPWLAPEGAGNGSYELVSDTRKDSTVSLIRARLDVNRVDLPSFSGVQGPD